MRAPWFTAREYAEKNEQDDTLARVTMITTITEHIHHSLLDEFGSDDTQERCTGLVGHGLRQKSLSRTRLPVQNNACINITRYQETKGCKSLALLYIPNAWATLTIVTVHVTKGLL